MVAAAAVVILLGFCSGKSDDIKATVAMPEIKIYIKGEIKSPGLYKIDADTRLLELIETAGGTTDNADLERLNLAAILTDGTTVKIPALGTEEDIDPMIAQTVQSAYENKTSAEKASSPDKITSGTININTAPASELMRLPGVGQSTADKIIKFRNESGRFMSIEEIMNVSGIGEKTFEKMKQFITVD